MNEGDIMLNRRNIEMDMMRGLAILAVILIHITAEIINSSPNMEEMNLMFLIVNQLSRFAVPVFLFISGLGLALSSRKENYFSFLRRRVSKLLPLYLLWSVLYYVAIHLKNINLLEFAILTLKGSNYYHLYYIPVIIMLYMLFPLLKKIVRYKVAVISVFLLTVIIQLSDELFDITVFKSAANVFNWSIYFILGIMFANNYNKLKITFNKKRRMSHIMFILVSAGIVLESYLYLSLNFDIGDSTTSLRPGVIIYTLSFIVLMMSIKWGRNKIVSVIDNLAKYSYGIYLSHALILTLWSKSYDFVGLQKDSILYLVLSLLVVLLSSTVVSRVVDFFMKKYSLSIVINKKKAS